MSVQINGTNGLVFADGSTQKTAANGSFKNRLINSDMRIDQRNAGASVTPADGTYIVDRWRVYASQSSKLTAQQNAGSVTPPAGFTNYLGTTSSSSYSVISSDIFLIQQFIEGLNVADLGWGTANAQPVTLSFWVRSSLTGTFSVVFGNSDFNRSYPATYTISAANTWEQKTVTISGDTTGNWLKTNGKGIVLSFGLGVGSTYNGTAGVWAGAGYYGATGATSVVGTNGATFYITGVQLEKGSTATSFDYRPYGTELALCQRYYFKTYPQDVVPGATGSGNNAPGRVVEAGNSYSAIQYWFPASMRASPSIQIFNPVTGATSSMRGDASNFTATSTFITPQCATVFANNVFIGQHVGISAHITASIEL